MVITPESADGRGSSIADPLDALGTLEEIRARQTRSIDTAHPLLTGALQQLQAMQQITTLVSTAMAAHAA